MHQTDCLYYTNTGRLMLIWREVGSLGYQLSCAWLSLQSRTMLRNKAEWQQRDARWQNHYEEKLTYYKRCNMTTKETQNNYKQINNNSETKLTQGDTRQPKTDRKQLEDRKQLQNTGDTQLSHKTTKPLQRDTTRQRDAKLSQID